MFKSQRISVCLAICLSTKFRSMALTHNFCQYFISCSVFFFLIFKALQCQRIFFTESHFLPRFGWGGLSATHPKTFFPTPRIQLLNTRGPLPHSARCATVSMRSRVKPYSVQSHEFCPLRPSGWKLLYPQLIGVITGKFAQEACCGQQRTNREFCHPAGLPR